MYKGGKSRLVRCGEQFGSRGGRAPQAPQPTGAARHEDWRGPHPNHRRLGSLPHGGAAPVGSVGVAAVTEGTGGGRWAFGGRTRVKREELPPVPICGGDAGEGEDRGWPVRASVVYWARPNDRFFFQGTAQSSNRVCVLSLKKSTPQTWPLASQTLSTLKPVFYAPEI